MMNSTPFNMSNKDRLLADWKLAKEMLDKAQTAERDLRAQVIEVFSTETNELKSGVENVPLGWGTHVLKIDHKITYSLDNSNDNENIHKAMDAFEEVGGEVGTFLADRVFKEKFEISVKEYKELDPKYKVIVDKILTIKPASKSISIVESKK